MSVLTHRFWSKVRDQHGCWQWTGSVNSRGYGQWAFNQVSKSVHRLTWIEFRGDIPDGLTIDHLCRNKRCVNPWHMELVTPRVNNQRRFGPDVCLLPVGTTAAWKRPETLDEKRRKEATAEWGKWFGALLEELFSPHRRIA